MKRLAIGVLNFPNVSQCDIAHVQTRGRNSVGVFVIFFNFWGAYRELEKNVNKVILRLANETCEKSCD